MLSVKSTLFIFTSMYVLQDKWHYTEVLSLPTGNINPNASTFTVKMSTDMENIVHYIDFTKF